MKKTLFCFLVFCVLTQSECYASGSRDWDGVDDQINCGSGASLDQLTSFTAAAWFKADSLGESSIGFIISKRTGSGAAAGWKLGVTDSGTEKLNVLCDFTGGGSVDGDWDTPADSIILGQWHHAALVYDRSATTNDPVIYIDGVSQSITEVTTPVGSAVDDSAQSFIIGNNAVGSTTFDGSIGYVLYIGRLFSGWEVTQAMWYPLSIPSALSQPIWGDTAEQDLSGNGNDGTVTGTTTVALGGPIVIGGLPL